jgi:hypothetical protein
VAAIATLAALAWIVAALVTVGHGFDTTDEGLYLLSYRWWDTDMQTFTGAQYFYGPVFAALGHSIAALRVFRVVTVVVVHATFGWTFMRWLRGHRPAAPASRLWEVSGTAAIVAAGGMIYSWLPLTPGYNDISVLGSLLAAAVLLRLATHIDRATPIRPWVPAVLGPILIVMGLGKWSSAALTFALIAVVGVVVLASRGVREVLRAVAWVVVGALVTAVLIQLLLIPLTRVVPELITTNRVASGGGSSIRTYLHGYRVSAIDLTIEILKAHGLLLLAAVVAALAPRRAMWRAVAAVLVVAGLGVSVFRIVADGDLQGGSDNVAHFPGPLVALVGVALIVGIAVSLDRRRPTDAEPGPGGVSSVRRAGRREWAIFDLLLLLPLTQAFGTSNHLYEVAIFAFATWAAVIIAMATGLEAAPRPARGLVWASAAIAPLLAVSIAVTATWSHPYRVAPRQDTTAVADGVPALSSVLLDPATARKWSTLRAELAPYVEPEGRAIMAFDELPGVVFLLGGRSVGEQWYSRIDRPRTAAGIRAACESGQPWWGSRAPVLIFNREVSDTEISALRDCGLTFATDYQQLPSRPELDGLAVYVPKKG